LREIGEVEGLREGWDDESESCDGDTEDLHVVLELFGFLIWGVET